MISSSCSSQLAGRADEPPARKSSYGSPGTPVSSQRITVTPARSSGSATAASPASSSRYFAPLCCRMYPTSALARRLLTATRIPPAAGTPKWASSIADELNSSVATRSPLPRPAALSALASRHERSANSRYEYRCPPSTTATLSGYRYAARCKKSTGFNSERNTLPGTGPSTGGPGTEGETPLMARLPRRRRSLLQLRYQDTRVHDPGRVQLSLRTAQRAGEQRRHLPQIPGAVVAPDRVMVGDGTAERKDRLRRRELDFIPLLEFLPRAAWCVHRVIRRRAVGIQVSEAARDRASAAHPVNGLK